MTIKVSERIRTTGVVVVRAVIKVSMNGRKNRTRAIKTVVCVEGIASVGLTGEEENQLVVIGSSFDAVLLVRLLRKKLGHAHLISICQSRWPNDRSQRIGNSSANGEVREPRLHLPSLSSKRVLKFFIGCFKPSTSVKNSKRLGDRSSKWEPAGNQDFSTGSGSVNPKLPEIRDPLDSDLETTNSDGEVREPRLHLPSLRLERVLKGTAPRTSPAASHMPLATFKDHATLQNPWSTCGNHNLSSPPPKSLQAVHQESTSDTLEETEETTSDTSEEAQILANLLEANGVNKLFDQLEAPFAPSGLLLGTSSNEAATHIQKGLAISLQSMTDVNGMIAVANNVFMILKSLGVDFVFFYEKVKIFLGCFALKTQLADSSNLSTAEFEAQYYEKKLHFDKVSSEHEQLSVSIIKSDEHIAGLNQKIIQTKELLKQLEEELSSTQAEHASFMCDFAQASENVSKSEEDVQTALNVLSQHKKKNGQHSVVERAFERAKASLNE